MNEIDVTQIKFRASSMYKLMVDPKDKTATISITTQSYLREVYRELRYNRRNVVTTKVLEKGLQNEEIGLTLFSRYKEQFFKKNEKQLFNPLVSGTPDFIGGEDSIENASQGWDLKCSYTLDSFPFKDEPLNPMYAFQAQTYMALTNAKKWTIVYVLTNTPAYQLINHKKQIWFTMGMPEEIQGGKNELYNRYKRDVIQLERNSIFNIKEFINDNPNYDFESPVDEWKYDIDIKERIIEFPVMRDEAIIKKMYQRVHASRNWMSDKINNGKW